MNEATVLKNVMKEASRIGSRLFRNNRGQFKTMDGKRTVRAGLEAPGSSDLIGPTPIVITQEMVGMTLGVLTAAETKHPDWKGPKDEHELEQENFINQMLRLGCIAFFITDHEDLGDKISECMAEKIFKNMLTQQKITSNV